MEKIGGGDGGVESDEEDFARPQDHFDGPVKIRQRDRLKSLFQQLDVPLEELGEDVFIVAQLGEGLFHAVGSTQLAAHLRLDFPLKFRKSFISQTLSEAHDG